MDNVQNTENDEVFKRERNMESSPIPIQDQKGPIISAFSLEHSGNNASNRTDAADLDNNQSQTMPSNLSNVEPLHPSTPYNLPNNMEDIDEVIDTPISEKKENEQQNINNSLIEPFMTTPISHGALIHSEDDEEDDDITATGTVTSALAHTLHSRINENHTDSDSNHIKNELSDDTPGYKVHQESRFTIHDL